MTIRIVVDEELEDEIDYFAEHMSEMPKDMKIVHLTHIVLDIHWKIEETREELENARAATCNPLNLKNE